METSKLREAREEMQRQLTEAETYRSRLEGAVEMLRLLIAQDEQEAATNDGYQIPLVPLVE